MSTLLEITGSTIIGGLIILIIFNLNSNIVQTGTLQQFDKISQSNITSLMEEIEYDLKKIGYRATDPAIITADSNAISFKYDTDNNGTEETISYFVSDTTTLSGTENPRDILLYRTVGAGAANPVTSNLGVTKFRLWYYDKSGNLTTTPANIRSIKFAVSVESPYPYDGEYASSYAVRLVQPNNLR